MSTLYQNMLKTLYQLFYFFTSYSYKIFYFFFIFYIFLIIFGAWHSKFYEKNEIFLTYLTNFYNLTIIFFSNFFKIHEFLKFWSPHCFKTLKKLKYEKHHLPHSILFFYIFFSILWDRKFCSLYIFFSLNFYLQ